MTTMTQSETDLRIVYRWDGTSHVVEGSVAKKTLCKWQFRPEQIARSEPWDPYQAVNLINQGQDYVGCQLCEYRANVKGGVCGDDEGQVYYTYDTRDEGRQ